MKTDFFIVRENKPIRPIGILLILASIVFGFGPLIASVCGQEFTLSTVQIERGCSGVIVSPGDLVLTAGHCDYSGRVSLIQENGDSHEGSVIFAPQGEGASVIRLDRRASLFADVASREPQAGEPVLCSGYPRGQFVRIPGSLLPFDGETRFKGIPFESYEASIQGAPGLSGGPLFNQEGKVIGLCSAGNSWEPRTLFISLGEIRKSLRAFQDTPSEKPKLRVWVQEFPPCLACIRFKTDYRSNKEFREALLGAFSSVEILDVNDHPELAKSNGVNAIPMFIVESGKRIQGYGGRVKLLNDLGVTKKPIPDPVSTVTVEEPSVDWSLVRIAVIVKKIDLGGVKGALASLAQQKTGSIERKISESTGGKARVDFIFERTSPERFFKVTEAAGVAPSPVCILALVKKQDFGIIKGLLVKRKLLPIAQEYLEGKIPIDVIPERVHPGDYSKTISALDHVESELPIGWRGTEGSEEPEDSSEEKEGEGEGSIDRLGTILSTLSNLKEDIDKEREEDPSMKISLPLLAGLVVRRLIVSLIGGRLNVGETG